MNDRRRKRRNLHLIKARCSRCSRLCKGSSRVRKKQVYGDPTGESKTARDRWRNTTGRYEKDTPDGPIKQTSHHLIARSICIHGISDFISRESSSLSCLSPFLMYFRRYSSPPLNERLIPLPVCPFLRFFPLASSGDRLPAYPLARTVTPSHQHLCFPLYRPVTSRLSLCGVPILPPAVRRTFLSFPASIFSLLLSRLRSPRPCARKGTERNDRRRWKVSPPPAPPPSLHTANPSFFSGVIGCTVQ